MAWSNIWSQVWFQKKVLLILVLILGSKFGSLFGSYFGSKYGSCFGSNCGSHFGILLDLIFGSKVESYFGIKLWILLLNQNLDLIVEPVFASNLRVCKMCSGWKVNLLRNHIIAEYLEQLDYSIFRPTFWWPSCVRGRFEPNNLHETNLQIFPAGALHACHGMLALGRPWNLDFHGAWS